jgi:hypothetical protein
MKKLLLASLAILALSATQAAAQNLVANPSFEDPTVDMGSANDAWFRFGSGAGTGVSSESTDMPRTGSRHMALELVGANQFAGVFQNLNMPVSPGQKFVFTGWAKNMSGAPFAATQELKLEWQGMPNPPQNRFDVLTLGSQYEQFMHMGVAPAGTTGLVVTYAISSFGAGQGDSLVFLDDISVTLIPEPTTLAMIVVAFIGLLSIRRR